MNDEAELERRLRAGALRPCDPEFTQRVLRELPSRSPGWRSDCLALSFALTTRLVFALVLLAAAQRWFSGGPGSVAHILVFLLFVVPVIAALSQLCGPLIPPSLRQWVWRAGRHWR